MSAEESVKEKLIGIEWEMFQRVQNEGGRADCQERPETFAIMRSAQFSAWPEDLAESYLEDLREALHEGRNLLTEKYARMMASTAPDEYRKIEDRLPVLTIRAKELVEHCAALETRWMEEYRKRYPKLAFGNRVIHTSEDTPYDTSFETYERGELSTYSERTLEFYSRFLDELRAEGKNLAILTMTAMVRQYGYKDLEDAEARIP